MAHRRGRKKEHAIEDPALLKRAALEALVQRCREGLAESKETFSRYYAAPAPGNAQFSEAQRSGARAVKTWEEALATHEKLLRNPPGARSTVAPGSLVTFDDGTRSFVAGPLPVDPAYERTSAPVPIRDASFCRGQKVGATWTEREGRPGEQDVVSRRILRID